MMNSLKLGVAMIQKNIWLNIMVSLFLALSVLSTVFTVLLTLEAGAHLKTYKQLEDKPFVHYNFYATSENEKKQVLNDMIEVEGLLMEEESVMKDLKSKSYNTHKMSKSLIDSIDVSMSRGVWLSEASQADGEVLACVSESLRDLYGQTLVLQERISGQTNTITIKIVGVIDASQKLPDYSRGPVTSFGNISKAIKEDTIVFEETNFDYITSSGLITFSNTISAKEFEKNVANLSALGKITLGKDIMLGTQKEFADTKNIILPFSVLSTAMSIFAIIIIVGIVLNKSNKSTGVLLMVGGGSKEVFFSIFTYFSFILLGMMLISVLGFVFIGSIGILTSARLGVAIGSLVGYSLILTISALGSSFWALDTALVNLSRREL